MDWIDVSNKVLVMIGDAHPSKVELVLKNNN